MTTSPTWGTARPRWTYKNQIWHKVSRGWCNHQFYWARTPSGKLSDAVHCLHQTTSEYILMWLWQNVINAITVNCRDCTGAFIVYQRCRRAAFSLDSCPVGSVISIQSARAEIRQTLYGQCQSWAHPSCTRSIINHRSIVSCNGQRTCSFSSDVLLYPQHNVTRLCDQSEDGNFIWVEYNCTTSKKHV